MSNHKKIQVTLTSIDAARTDRTPCFFGLLLLACFAFKNEDVNSITASTPASGSCFFDINEISKQSFDSSEGLTPTGRWNMLRLSTIGASSASLSWAHSFATSNPGPRFQFPSCSLGKAESPSAS